MPANKGEALAMHRSAFFAGKPAPTGTDPLTGLTHFLLSALGS